MTTPKFIPRDDGNGTTMENRRADYDLWQLFKIKRHKFCESCPKCGSRNTRYDAAGICHACKLREIAVVVADEDSGVDVLSFDAETQAMLDELRAKRVQASGHGAKEPAIREYSARGFVVEVVR